MNRNRTYIAIDLKSFYASVECHERGLDPLKTNLVVADVSRTAKTICLAVSPPLKERGVGSRPRLFEVIQKVEALNRERLAKAAAFHGKSYDDTALRNDPGLALDYLIAPPRMAYYIAYSTQIYNIYLRYVAKEDIHVYSIDEVFMDVTAYLNTYRLDAHALAEKIILEVLKETGITATAGIGTNLYLAKIAMDIVAKHLKADPHGVRIAALDELSYRKLLWSHEPLTDFWRVGKGYARSLEKYGIYTMGDIARCSLNDEELLYRLFGVNAELLIDHAWGYEPCTLKEIKAYRPLHNSLGSGQVLHQPYPFAQAELVLKEMVDNLALALFDKGLVTKQLVLTIGYDSSNLLDPVLRANYRGKIKKDLYGREIPEHAHGTVNLSEYSASGKLLRLTAVKLYRKITDPHLLIRRINIVAAKVISQNQTVKTPDFLQTDLFKAPDLLQKEAEAAEESRQKEEKMQAAILKIKKKYGKNAILRGMNLEEGATAKERNRQIGGHKA